MSFVCSICGQTHEGLSAWTYRYPDPWLALSDEERSAGKIDTDLCRTRAGEYFVRATLELPLIGGPEPTFEFGLWGSLSEASFYRYVETYDDLDQSNLGPLFSYLSNELRGFPGSFALQADMVPQDGQRPKLVLHNADHPLARAQVCGVEFQKVLEIIHPTETAHA